MIQFFSVFIAQPTLSKLKSSLRRLFEVLLRKRDTIESKPSQLSRW